MLKKNQKIFIVIFLIFLLVFLNYPEKKIITQVPKNQPADIASTNKPNTKDLLPNYYSINVPLNKKDEPQKLKPLTDKDCWDKESNLFVEDPEFIIKNKHIFNRFVGPWFYNSEEKSIPEEETSIGGLFLLALAKSDLIYPSTKINLNYDESLEILHYLNKEDPTNSAPLVFAAEIQRRLGNLESMKLLLEKALSTERFDTYQSHLSQIIFDQVETPNELVAAINLNSKLPIILISSLKETLISPVYAPLAYQMMESALDPIHDIDPSHFAESFQYNVGDIILKKMGYTSKRKTASDIIVERFQIMKCKPGFYLEYLDQLKKKRKG